MDDRDWLILQLLYKKKNITKTAQSLYISQPSLTHRLQQIEKELGVTLVNRGRRGVQFTPQGEYVAKHANQILLDIQKIKENVSNMEKDVVGTLRLGVSDSFTHYKLPQLLKAFKEDYPKVEFKVTTDWSKEIVQLAYNQDIHIGIVRGDYSWQGEKHLLFSETLCIVSKEKINIKDLPNLPRIDYRTDYLLRAMIDNWWTDNFAVAPRVNIEVDRADTCKGMVLNGLGYAIVPSMIVENVDNIHKIDLIDKKGNPILRPTWMIYYKDTLDMSIVHAFADFVLDTHHVEK
ncbi:LysR family transcriptional regulator [Terrilactibacillus laevilacticus]|uniref:LysR family transcriptional regulator n=1 Tax=Terrilactibacillus laevilacticus TaxID=1380157 RepID=A0ABW5PQZ7_9BACI|nr:LysR family transcriptional regulator [Terrilactibacillus laevilacticus]